MSLYLLHIRGAARLQRALPSSKSLSAALVVVGVIVFHTKYYLKNGAAVDVDEKTGDMR